MDWELVWQLHDLVSRRVHLSAPSSLLYGLSFLHLLLFPHKVAAERGILLTFEKERERVFRSQVFFPNVSQHTKTKILFKSY